MAKDQGVKDRGAPTASARRPRTSTAASTPSVRAAAAPAEPSRRRTSPTQFSQEVRAEVRKITWPTWKETWITSVMVFVMVAVTSVFFLVVDGGFNFLEQQFLTLAG